METCEGCGFAWQIVGPDEIGPRTLAGAAAIAALLRGGHPGLGERPASGDGVERWSALEYAAHARDVMLTLRDRCVVGLVRDNPEFMPMFRDERVTLGLYAADTADAVAAEVEAAASMFVRLFDAIEPAALARPVRYGFPDPFPATVLWMGQQVVHETEHHLGDIRQNLA